MWRTALLVQLFSRVFSDGGLGRVLAAGIRGITEGVGYLMNPNDFYFLRTRRRVLLWARHYFDEAGLAAAQEDLHCLFALPLRLSRTQCVLFSFCCPVAGALVFV